MKALEWRDSNIFPHDVCWARNRVSGGFMDGYEITRSEKYGGFEVSGMLPHRKDSHAKTIAEAKAIAEDDYQRRQRTIAWREYMETNDPPSPQS